MGAMLPNKSQICKEGKEGKARDMGKKGKKMKHIAVVVTRGKRALNKSTYYESRYHIRTRTHSVGV